MKTCHRRNAFAMGGMAAQLPIRNDLAVSAAAPGKVRADKLREATDGDDVTWVAHPGLAQVVKAVFDGHMPASNQTHCKRDDVKASARDPLDFRPEGLVTEAGLRDKISVGIQHIGARLAAGGRVPAFNLMEDAARQGRETVVARRRPADFRADRPSPDLSINYLFYKVLFIIVFLQTFA